MKQVKNLMMIAVAIFMATTMTSCLDNESGPPTGGGLATLESGYMGMSPYFIMENGEKMIPSGFDASNYDGFRRVYIIYTFNDEEEFNAQANKKPEEQEYHVTLNGIINLEERGNVNITARGSASDSLMTKCKAPINGIDTLYIKDGYLMAFTDFTINHTAHALPIFYYTNDETKTGAGSSPDTIDLYMGNNIMKDNIEYASTTSKYFAYTYPSFYFRAYNLADIIRYANYDTSKSDVVLNVITRQTKAANDTINVAYTVKYPIRY